MLTLKYRPRKFQDLVGQEHVVIILAAILKKHFKGTQKLPAGFLFAGSKGTGKTTTARIVAALLNCEVELETLTPCGECSSCQAVWMTNSMFVHEIDAASNGLVEDIRKIKDIVSLHHSGKVRVILLDEAHSLTRSAWDALLKQLEEPRDGVIYILCSTEPDKFPDTILSRLMQFTFKQVVPELIAARLQQIAITENIQVAEMAALHAIARKAQGAMRDSIMMLEQMANYRQQIKLADFLEYYGLVGTDITRAFLDLAQKADIIGAKKLIASQFTRSIDVDYFLDQFMLDVTESMTENKYRPEQIVDSYRAAVEVKSKVKNMSAFVAANYLFALLLRAFSHEGGTKSGAMSQEKLEDLFA